MEGNELYRSRSGDPKPQWVVATEENGTIFPLMFRTWSFFKSSGIIR